MQANKPPKKKFKSNLTFSHRLPYDRAFAERVPVLYALRMAVSHYKEPLDPPVGRRAWVRRLAFGWKRKTFLAAECGVYTGACLVASAALLKEAGVPFRYHGLDTFTGLPDLSETDRQLAPDGAVYLTEATFTDTSVEQVAALVRDRKLERSVKLIPGLFSDTLSCLPDGPYHFVNIDCDLFEPHLECLEFFYPRMARGGVIFFDDYHSVAFPMAGAAIDQFMKDKPEELIHMRYGPDTSNRTKAFFVKF